MLEKNCYGIGLAAGFLEPLESTSIAMIQTSLARLMQYFPTLNTPQIQRDCVNREFCEEYEHARDFILLHYIASVRRDSPFWCEASAVSLPASLRRVLEVFKEIGTINESSASLFKYNNWLAVLMGMGVVPKHYHGLLAGVKDGEVIKLLTDINQELGRHLRATPLYCDFLNQEFPKKVLVEG